MLTGRVCGFVILIGFSLFMRIDAKINSESIETEDPTADVESDERVGARVTQVQRHPYAASLLKSEEYVCSSVILNEYWLISLSKCFEPGVIYSYVTHGKLRDYSIRTGSSYNNKGGTLSKLKMLINNFDMKSSAIKLESPLVFSAAVSAVKLPSVNDEVNLGQLVNLLAWAPNGHLRLVNVPAIEPSLCESFTNLAPGHYVCVAGIQDPDRHFCRRDNGGAVIQNDTLVAMTSFILPCAVYTKIHSFPRITPMARWLDSVIWDENNRPTIPPKTTSTTTAATFETTVTNKNHYFSDPKNYMLTLPYEPINVPLEPSLDNTVMSRMSLYESYLKSRARARTSTTPDPNEPPAAYGDRQWMQNINKAIMMMPPPSYIAKKHDLLYDYDPQ